MYCIGGILVILLLATVYLGYQTDITWSNMNEWKYSAELYEAQSKHIKLFTCKIDDKTSRVCVQVDPKYKDQEWGENLKILTLKAD